MLEVEASAEQVLREHKSLQLKPLEVMDTCPALKLGYG